VLRILLLVLLVVVVLGILLFAFFIWKAPEYTENKDGSMKPEVRKKKRA